MQWSIVLPLLIAPSATHILFRRAFLMYALCFGENSPQGIVDVLLIPQQLRKRGKVFHVHALSFFRLILYNGKHGCNVLQ